MTKISIIGLGYAGLTLALEFGKRFSVVGYDINLNRINELKFGYDRTLEIIQSKSDKVNYIGREPAASPATGYLKKHLAQQKEIIEKVLS